MNKTIDQKWFDSKLTLSGAFVVDVLFRNRKSKTLHVESEDDLLSFAGQNGVAALLYKKLSGKAGSTIPASVLASLKNEYLRTLVLNTNLLKKAHEINSILRNKGVEPVFLKGILLAPFLYRDPALRPMGDIDLLVSEKEVQEAYDVLIEEGAVPADPMEKDHASNHHLPMIIFKSAPVEIHRFLTSKDSDYFIPPISIFSKKITWSNGREELPGPSFIDAFIYMAVHVYYTFLRGGMRLSWMYDFYLMTEQEGKAVDVKSKEFTERVKDWNVEYPVCFISVLLSFLLGKEPEFKEWKKDKKLLQDLSLAAGFFSTPPDDSEFYSYRLIWEQVKNTKGFKNKVRIFKIKLFRRSDENVISRFAKLSGRFSGMIFNSTKLSLKRLFRRF